MRKSCHIGEQRSAICHRIAVLRVEVVKQALTTFSLSYRHSVGMDDSMRGCFRLRNRCYFSCAGGSGTEELEVTVHLVRTTWNNSRRSLCAPGAGGEFKLCMARPGYLSISCPRAWRVCQELSLEAAEVPRLLICPLGFLIFTLRSEHETKEQALVSMSES